MTPDQEGPMTDTHGNGAQRPHEGASGRPSALDGRKLAVALARREKAYDAAVERAQEYGRRLHATDLAEGERRPAADEVRLAWKGAAKQAALLLQAHTAIADHARAVGDLERAGAAARLTGAHNIEPRAEAVVLWPGDEHAQQHYARVIDLRGRRFDIGDAVIDVDGAVAMMLILSLAPAAGVERVVQALHGILEGTDVAIVTGGRDAGLATVGIPPATTPYIVARRRKL